MKKILIILLIIPVLGFSQVIENVDFISPFHDEMAAIKYFASNFIKITLQNALCFW